MGKLKKAPCWAFFSLEKDDKAKCTLCGRIYSLSVNATTGGIPTSTLNRHLDSDHQYEFSKEKERRAELDSKKRKADINTYFGPCPKSLKTEKTGSKHQFRCFSQQTLAESLKRNHEKKNG